MRTRSAPARFAVALAVALLPVVAFSAGAAAKGTPSTVTVTCGAGVTSATVTVQLMSAVTNPKPASNQLVLACSTSAPTATAKIAPLHAAGRGLFVVGVRHGHREHVRLWRHRLTRHDRDLYQ